MPDGTPHPVIVDTDALVAVANTNLWDRILETLNLTTTNVCRRELDRHTRENSAYASEGTRTYRLYHGSEKALTAFNSDDDSFSVVTCVPRPHGRDAGEESIKRQVEQHPDQYTYAILMDKHGRKIIDREFEDGEGRAVAPTFLLYLLYDSGACTEEEFCRACGDLLEGEGWTGYQAVQAAWEAIPIDCSEYLDTELLE